MLDIFTNLDMSDWIAWLTGDPAGQRIGLGLMLGVLLLGVLLLSKAGQAVAKRCKHLPLLLLLCGGVYYTLVILLQLDPSNWAPAAGVVALSLLVLALLGAVRTRHGKPKAKTA